ncbi:MAG: 50S ribosomal protein L37e [Nanobdellota archaeon]
MGTGTASLGRKNKGTNHIMCRRCGNRSFHKSAKVCSNCGFGKSSKIKKFKWNKK